MTSTYEKIDKLERAVNGLLEGKRIIRATAELLLGRCQSLRVELAALLSSPRGPRFDREASGISVGIADLELVVGSLGKPVSAGPAEELAEDLMQQLLGESTEVEAVVVVGAVARTTPFCFPWATDAQFSLVVLLPHAGYAEVPLCGVLAHETAHLDPLVAERKGSFRRETRMRGEVLADAFGIAMLGPGFGRSISAHLGRAKSRPDGEPQRSDSHPPWSLRVLVLAAIAREIWDSADIVEWVMRELAVASSAAGAPPPASWPPTVDECLGDVRAAHGRIRNVKIGEIDLRDVRSKKRGRSKDRPILVFNAACLG